MTICEGIETSSEANISGEPPLHGGTELIFRVSASHDRKGSQILKDLGTDFGTEPGSELCQDLIGMIKDRHFSRGAAEKQGERIVENLWIVIEREMRRAENRRSDSG